MTAPGGGLFFTISTGTQVSKAGDFPELTRLGHGQCGDALASCLPGQGIPDLSPCGSIQPPLKLHWGHRVLSSMLLSQRVFAPSTRDACCPQHRVLSDLVFAQALFYLPSSLNSFAGKIHHSRFDLKVCAKHCLLSCALSPYFGGITVFHWAVSSREVASGVLEHMLWGQNGFKF